MGEKVGIFFEPSKHIFIYRGGEMKAFLMSFLVMGSLFIMTNDAKAAPEAAQCVYELRNGRGFTLQTFRDFSYNYRSACRQARRDCLRTARAGYYRARRLICAERRTYRRPLPRRYRPWPRQPRRPRYPRRVPRRPRVEMSVEKNLKTSNIEIIDLTFENTEKKYLNN
ncbi:MAG: hypothetical protein CME62_13895 [Halobacteriovoraceae bacterium]|nr:hypothetical protein [Halobacteriovoraceae bacterium]